MTRAIRSRILFVLLLCLLACALAALSGFTITNLATRVEAANSRNAEQSEQIGSLLEDLHASQENAQQLYDQLLALGESPEGEAPDDVVTISPENGRDGNDGERGERGPAPTAAQVLEGIRVCFASGTCTAPKGDPGLDGVDGRDGVDGKDGNDSTVPGPAGTPGVGIAAIACLEDGTWQFTMTDGSVRDVPGPCRVPPIIEPTPETPEGEPTP